MKITFKKAYKKYAVGDSDDFPQVEAVALIGIGLAEQTFIDVPAPKKGKEQVSE